MSDIQSATATGASTNNEGRRGSFLKSDVLISNWLDVTPIVQLVFGHGNSEEGGTRENFVAMYTELFDPLTVFLASEERIQTEIGRALRKFREVYRKRFRQTPHYLTIPVLKITNEKAIEEGTRTLEKQLLEVESDKDVLRTALNLRMATEHGWIWKVNEIKRNQFHLLISKEALLTFKDELNIEYPFFIKEGGKERVKFYDEQDIDLNSNAILSKTLKEFNNQFPIDEEDSLVKTLSSELEQKLGKIREETMMKNQDSKRIHVRKCIQEAGNKYATLMNDYITRSPLTPIEKVQEYHYLVKDECFQVIKQQIEKLDSGFVSVVWDEVIGRAYESIVEKSKQIMEVKLTECFETLKEKVSKFVKKEGEKMFKKYTASHERHCEKLEKGLEIGLNMTLDNIKHEITIVNSSQSEGSQAVVSNVLSLLPFPVKHKQSPPQTSSSRIQTKECVVIENVAGCEQAVSTDSTSKSCQKKKRKSHEDPPQPLKKRKSIKDKKEEMVRPTSANRHKNTAPPLPTNSNAT